MLARTEERRRIWAVNWNSDAWLRFTSMGILFLSRYLLEIFLASRLSRNTRSNHGAHAERSTPCPLDSSSADTGCIDLLRYSPQWSAGSGNRDTIGAQHPTGQRKRRLALRDQPGC